MTIVPRTDPAAIEFFLGRAEGWIAGAAELGLSVEQAEAMRQAALAADQALRAAIAARQAAESATLALREAVAAMRRRGGGVIGTIRARAAATNNPGLLTTAALTPASQRRAPLPPARPRIVGAALGITGEVTLRWAVRHTRETRGEGTLYFIERRLGAEGEGSRRWTQIGSTGGGVRRGEGSDAGNSGWMFTDRTLPRGVAFASYRIVPRRAGIEGAPSGEWMQHFGTRAG